MKGLTFRLASSGDAAQIEAFNRRIAAATHHRVSLEKPFATIAQDAGSPIIQERVFCFEGDELRGAASARRMTFFVHGRPEEVATWMAPVSEGLVNPDYALVALRIEREMRRRYPLIYGTGSRDGGGEMMYRAGWFTRQIPFHFAVLRPAAFLRNIDYLRRRRAVRILADVAAASGAGTLGFAVLDLLQRARGRYASTDGVIVERVEGWGEWVDDVWERARGKYALIGDRSSKALASLYPTDNEHFIRLRFSSADAGRRVLGWAVVTASRVRSHKHFGNMVLGAVVDVLAEPEDAVAVARGAVAALRDLNADLVVVNHSDRRWNEAFERAGMLPGTTNHYMFLAPALKERFSPIDDYADRFFFTRGDGHGPMHLW